MKLSARLLLAVFVVAVLAIAFIYSGIYNIGADDPHYRLVHSVLEVARERSIETRSDEIEVPDLDDAMRIRSGAGNYHAMCTGCHLAPGMPPTEWPAMSTNNSFKSKPLRGLIQAVGAYGKGPASAIESAQWPGRDS